MRYSDRAYQAITRIKGKALLTSSSSWIILIYFFIFLLFATAKSYATTKLPIIDLDALAGVNRVFYSVEWGPHTPDVIFESEINFDEQLAQVLKEKLSQTDLKISIENARDIPVEKWKASDLLLIRVGFTVREEVHNSQSLKLASMVLMLTMNGSEELPLQRALIVPAITYAFVLPDKPEDLSAKFKAGVNYLISYLPSHIRCAKKIRQRELCGNLVDPY